MGEVPFTRSGVRPPDFSPKNPLVLTSPTPGVAASGLGGPLQCGQPVSRPVSDGRVGFDGFSVGTVRCDLLPMKSRGWSYPLRSSFNLQWLLPNNVVGLEFLQYLSWFSIFCLLLIPFDLVKAVHSSSFFSPSKLSIEV